jgi:hypothetical protein
VTWNGAAKGLPFPNWELPPWWTNILRRIESNDNEMSICKTMNNRNNWYRNEPGRTVAHRPNLF